MHTALDSSVGVVAYLALFAVVGVVFLFVNLLVGRFLRPANPHAEKLEIYECGEPSIGSSFVQFDLRFYVVALLFIVFDVEVAFFFPWAVVFGKANNLAAASEEVVTLVDGKPAFTDNGSKALRELGVRSPQVPTDDNVPQSLRDAADASVGTRADAGIRGSYYVKHTAGQLGTFAMLDMVVFFAVLLVGFAYVWHRGDLDWVRAVSRDRALSNDRSTTASDENAPALSA